MDDRKGLFTPEQEKILDDIIKMKNPLAEAADGPLISLIDNQGIERLTSQLEAKYPDALPIVYEIVDILFAGLSQLTNEEPEA
jgi:uncharacterized protein (UPF0216 family)